MKKIRYIPYGYSVRDGHTVIAHREAEIIQEIFGNYITGASLKEIADDLTQRRVVYTEKTDVWDKARVSRILDNTKYLGHGEYDPIIDQETFDRACSCKLARKNYQDKDEKSEIAALRDKVMCGRCGAPMQRRLNAQRKIKTCWGCTNPECGCRVRIDDSELLRRVTLLMNRIIENTDLLIPHADSRKEDSPAVARIKEKIDEGLNEAYPSEDYIITMIKDLASQLYSEARVEEKIATQILRKRVSGMGRLERFNSECFSELIAFITIDDSGTVVLHTRTKTTVGET